MKKNILLITQGFPYGESEYSFLGTEYFELRKKYNVIILSLLNDEPLRFQVDNANVIRYSYKKTLLLLYAFFVFFDINFYKELYYARRETNFFQYVLRVKSIFLFDAHAIYAKKRIETVLKNNDVQLIYTYWCTPETLAGVKIKAKRQIKLLTRAHGYDLYNFRTKENWQPFRRVISKHSDAIVLACNNAKSYFDEQWGGHTYTSYIGSERKNCIDIKEQSNVLVSCSNIIELKRVQLIVRALSKIPENIKIEWHHFGTGDQEDSIKRLAFDLLNCKKNIKYYFHGYLKNEEVLKCYETLKPGLFITTTQTEGGCPVSLQEIAAFGIPAIGTCVGGVPDIIIDHQTGYLLSENPSIDEIKERIIEYYNLDDVDKNKMKENMYNHWKENFDSKRCAKKFIDIIDGLL